MKTLTTLCVVLLFLFSSCSPSSEELNTRAIAKQDTTWSSRPFSTAICHGKLINGKVEGDVYTKFDTTTVLIQKYINGIETGEYKEFITNGYWVECTYLKDSVLFKVVTHINDKLYSIFYIDLKGSVPSYDNLSEKRDFSRDKIVREFGYTCFAINDTLIHDGILHYERNYSRTNHNTYENIYYNDDGSVSGKTNYQNGKLEDGIQVLRYGDGNIKQIDTIVNGYYSGRHVEYFPSGQIKLEYNNAKNGPLKEYYESGQVVRESMFVNGKIRGVITTYSELGEVIGTEESYADKSEKNIAKAFADQRRAERANETQKSYVTDGQKCTYCKIGYYRGGACDMCSVVSKERLNESHSKAPKCERCKGDGYYKDYTNRGENKICDFCNGKGIVIH
jgi:antitoxin component YwqK of YwqJK toxin-antitoxin module